MTTNVWRCYDGYLMKACGEGRFIIVHIEINIFV